MAIRCNGKKSGSKVVVVDDVGRRGGGKYLALAEVLSFLVELLCELHYYFGLCRALLCISIEANKNLTKRISPFCRRYMRYAT